MTVFTVVHGISNAYDFVLFFCSPGLSLGVNKQPYQVVLKIKNTIKSIQTALIQHVTLVT